VRVTAIILIVLCLAAVGGLGYLYMNSRLTVEAAGCIAADAVTERETFDRLKAEALGETLAGTVFQPPEDATAENSQYNDDLGQLGTNPLKQHRVQKNKDGSNVLKDDGRGCCSQFDRGHV
jgi:hypothetical protein